MENVSAFYNALIAAKRNIKPPKKNKKAAYGRYADLEAILDAIEGPLADQGLVISQAVDMDVNGNPFLRTDLCHAETGITIDSKVPLLMKRENDPQALGGSITYARRYGITALLSIVADDDDDGNTSSGKNRDGTPKKPEGSPKKQKEQEVVDKVNEVFGSQSTLPDKMVDALFKEFTKAGFADGEVTKEVSAVIGREVKQVPELTEAEARTAVGHARKVAGGDAERLT